MKYKMGDYVKYEGEKCLIIGCYEDLATFYDKDNNIEKMVEIYYDLKDADGTTIDYVLEEELAPYEDKKEWFILKNGATYTLRNHMKAVYEEVGDVIVTEEGIMVPRRFYDKEGKCSAYPSFDIIEEITTTLDEEDNEDFESFFNDDWNDWCVDEECDCEKHDKEKVSYPLTLKDADGKYHITFNKGTFGWTFSGDLPEEVEDFLSTMLK